MSIQFSFTSLEVIGQCCLWKELGMNISSWPKKLVKKFLAPTINSTNLNWPNRSVKPGAFQIKEHNARRLRFLSSSVVPTVISAIFIVWHVFYISLVEVNQAIL